MEPLTVDPMLSVSLRFLAGVVAGVVATLVMDVVMARRPEGTTPQSIAAGVLTDRPPADAPARLTTSVHYLAGFLTGPLFVWLLYTSEGLLGGQSTVATATAAVVLYVLMVGFFAGIVLPRSLVAAQRIGQIQRDWAVSAAAYVVVVTLLVSLASGLL